MTVTQKDIAAAAGVSTTAVSFVMTGRAEEMQLSAATIRRVRAAAARLGFTANYHARSLSTGRSRTLGLIAGGDSRTLLHHFWSPVAAGVSAHACERGYSVLIVGGGADAAREFLQQKRIDGLIALEYPASATARVPHRAPAVVIGAKVRGCASVTLDDAAGIAAAVCHLKERGHADVLFIGRSLRGEHSPEQRLRAFAGAARDAGIKARTLCLCLPPGNDRAIEWYIAHYRDELTARLKLQPATTAVICYNDNIALALYAVLGACGLRIPGDISVIGFDDMYAASTIPALTTVSHMLPEMGAAAVDLLVGMIETKHPLRAIHVTPRLVVRASTAAARKRRDG